MRILNIIHDFLPDHQGGVEKYVFNLSRQLTSLGNDLLIFCGDPLFGSLKTYRDNYYQDLSVRYVAVAARKDGIIPGQNFFGSLVNRRVERIFRETIREFKPEVIHIHHTMNLSTRLVLIAKREGVPVVVTLHDYWPICQRVHLLDSGWELCSGPETIFKCAGCEIKDRSFIYWWPALMGYYYRFRLQKRFFNEADIITVPSRFMKPLYQNFGIDGEKIRVVPYGIEEGGYRPLKRNSADREGVVFGYLGSIKKHKGLEILVEAFRRTKAQNIKLLIYGDPESDRSYSSKLIKVSSHPRIQFMGGYAYGDLDRVLSEIDVVVIPSIWPETGPLVLLEAFSRGRPVVASRIGGMQEMILDGENGLLFEPGISHDLSFKMKIFAEKPSKIIEMAANILPVRSITENSLEMLNIYREALIKQRKKIHEIDNRI